MSQITISPETMRTRATEYSQHQAELDELTGKLDTLLATLEGEWQGAATESFRSQWEGIKPSFTNCSTLLAEINQQLNQTATAMEDLDSNIASQMGVQ